MSQISCHSSRQIAFLRTPVLTRIGLLAGAALALAACGNVEPSAEDLTNQTDAAVDAAGVVNAIRSSVNEEAVEGAIKGAAAQAIREELGVVGSVVDEDALVSGVDKAVDGKAVTSAISQAARDAAGAPPPKAGE